MTRGRLWRVVRWAAGILLVVFVAIQFVPYGWGHPNPPVTQDAPWPDAESERLVSALAALDERR